LLDLRSFESGIEREMHNGTMELIRAESVVKRQGHQFKLGPIDLALRSGEVLGVIGEKGSGKTTLLRLIWGFLRPDQGTVSVFRLQPHLNQISVRRHAGYLSESPCFDEWMTARRHVQFMSRYYEGWNEATADLLLERFGIDPGMCVFELSEGAKVKLALISAAGHNPFLLLLDDPMARLATDVQSEISVFLKTLAKERGIGIVVSSRCSSNLSQLTDSTMKLVDGKIVN
jgi:ABC-2 type transport system ATP-binding protein